MYSNLIAKARNLVVEFFLRSGDRKLAGKVIESDEVFVEVIVRIKEKTGEFAADRKAFEEAVGAGWREDRILINVSDISIIA